jgi:hypothetical protein
MESRIEAPHEVLIVNRFGMVTNDSILRVRQWPLSRLAIQAEYAR